MTDDPAQRSSPLYRRKIVKEKIHIPNGFMYGPRELSHRDFRPSTKCAASAKQRTTLSQRYRVSICSESISLLTTD